MSVQKFVRSHTLIILVLIVLQTFAQYQVSWIVPQTKSITSIKIASSYNNNKVHLIIGLTTGQIQIIQAKSRELVKQYKIFEEAITKIQVDSDNGFVFVAGEVNIAFLDHQYNIIKILKYKEPIKQIALSKYQAYSYINIQRASNTYSLLYFYPNYNSSHEDSTIWKSQYQQHIVEMSLNHQYLYTVSKDQHQFNIYKVPVFTKTNQSVTTNTYQLQQSKILNRKFSFKIDKLVIDRKQVFNSKDQDILMITDQQTIYYIKSGNIVTYIPYSSSKSQQLITVDYCQNIFLLIIHQRIVSNNESQFYISLIRKDTLFTHKVVLLNTHYGKQFKVVRVDCNFNLIVVQTDDNSLIVLQSYREFQIGEYFAYFISGGLLFTILLGYCCCRQENSKYASVPKQTKEENIQQQAQQQQSKQPLLKKQKKKLKSK